jgi:hypothetical protein
MPVLEQALKVAQNFQPYTPEEIQALLARTAPAAGRGEHELYKTSLTFDATATHPQWLG